MYKVLVNILAATVMLITTSGIAFAEGEKDYNLKAEVPARFWYSDKFKIKPSDAPKGVYIVTMVGRSTTYPIVTGLIKDKFRANGFIVTDKIEEADLGITFITTGVPQLDDVETNLAHINKEFVASALGAAALTGGISLVSTGMQMLGKTKGLANLTGSVSKGSLTLNDKGMIKADKTIYEGRITSNFAADETNPTVHSKLFEIVLEGFMREFTMQDVPAVQTDAAAAASGVPGSN